METRLDLEKAIHFLENVLATYNIRIEGVQ
jgi:hypothetical protein